MRRRRTFGAQVYHRVQLLEVLKEADGTRDDGTLMFARVTLLAGDVHSAGMAEFAEDDTRMAFERHLGV